MDQPIFWRFIADGSKYKTREQSVTYWVSRLCEAGDPGIFTFYDIFHTYFRLLDQNKIQAAAALLIPGCDDDSFDGFRAWIIAQGERCYRGVLMQPEYLAEWCSPGGIFTLPELLRVPYDAYFQNHQNSGDASGFARAQEVYGLTPIQKTLLEEELTFAFDINQPWDADDLPYLLPRLYEKFHG